MDAFQSNEVIVLVPTTPLELGKIPEVEVLQLDQQVLIRVSRHYVDDVGITYVSRSPSIQSVPAQNLGPAALTVDVSVAGVAIPSACVELVPARGPHACAVHL